MTEHNRNLLILSFVRRYADDHAMRGFDLERPAGTLWRLEGLIEYLVMQNRIGYKTAEEILSGQTVFLHPYTIKCALNTIAEERLPEDLLAVKDSVPELARVMQEKYPQAYQEYEKWLAAPRVYLQWPEPETGPHAGPSGAIVMTGAQVDELTRVIADDPKLRKNPQLIKLMGELGITINAKGRS